MARQENRDIDLMKIEIYADRSHAVLTTMLAFVFAVLLALFAVLFTLLLQKASIILLALVWVVMIVFTFPSALYIIADYKEDVGTISTMMEMVKKGIELPELEKIRREEIEKLWNKNTKKEN
jgi:VIT1/CCC1 family predicted Fe2+/Mn2+ transporter